MIERLFNYKTRRTSDVNSLYTCNCDVIHEDIVNDVKGKMQPKDDYIQLASLFKLFGDGLKWAVKTCCKSWGEFFVNRSYAFWSSFFSLLSCIFWMLVSIIFRLALVLLYALVAYHIERLCYGLVHFFAVFIAELCHRLKLCRHIFKALIAFLCGCAEIRRRYSL